MRRTIVFLLLLVAASAFAQPLSKVISVTDGDTFVALMADGRKERIRLIGIDAPESRASARKKVQPFGKEAAVYAKRLLNGKRVRLVNDVAPRDRYGRRLCYVYLADGRMVNALMLADGYARVMTVPPNTRYAKKFLDLERSARKNKRGLWRN